MKINTILAILQIFLICSSSVLAVKDQIKVSRLHSRRHKKISRAQKFNMKSCEKPTIDFIAFIKGIYDAVNDSVEGVLTSFILQKYKVQEGTEQCYSMVEEAFNAKIHAAEKEVEKVAKNGLNNVLDQVKALNVKVYSYEISLMENLRGNPKAFCKTAKKTIKFKVKEDVEKEAHLKKVIGYLEDPEKQSWTLEDWKDFKKGLFTTYETRDEIYQKLKDRVHKHPELAFSKILHNVLDEYKKDYKKVEDLLKNAKPITELKCKNLPDDVNFQRDCYQVGVGVKARQFWELIKHPDSGEIKKCLKTILTEMIYEKLISVSVETIINIILNAVGFFMSTFFKVVVFAFIFIERVIKATTSKDVKEKSQAMGEAIGYAYHIVTVMLQVGRRRLLKLRKLK
jgi:hypothetical protein